MDNMDINSCINYNSLSNRELKSICKRSGIKYHSYKKKKELIDIINSNNKKIILSTADTLCDIRLDNIKNIKFKEEELEKYTEYYNKKNSENRPLHTAVGVSLFLGSILHKTILDNNGEPLYLMDYHLLYAINYEVLKGKYFISFINKTFLEWGQEFIKLKYKYPDLYKTVIRQYVEPYIDIDNTIINQYTNKFILKKYLISKLNKINYTNIKIIISSIKELFEKCDKDIVNNFDLFYRYATDNDFKINQFSYTNMNGLFKLGNFVILQVSQFIATYNTEYIIYIIDKVCTIIDYLSIC